MMSKSSLLWLALAMGCSNGSNNVANADAEPADPGPLVAQIASAQCRKILECCNTDELERVLGAGIEDQGGCETVVRSQAEAFFLPAIERALEAGTIRLAEYEITGCVDALDARECDEFEAAATADVLDKSACSLLVVPRLKLSGFCTDDFECETGFCSRPPAETEGSCKNPPQIDDPCLNDRCDSFLACSPDDVCVEKLGDGEVCTRNADCRSDVCSPGEEGELVCVNVAEICTE